MKALTTFRNWFSLQDKHSQIYIRDRIDVTLRYQRHAILEFSFF
jgi:hypothetical protein